MFRGGSVLFFFITAVVSFGAQAAIFGIDTRIAIDGFSPSEKLARSTAIAVLSANYSESTPGHLKLDTSPMTELICSNERFASDPSLSYSCSGFLVGRDLIATAGHCMINTGEDHNETDTYCGVYSWLFDYQIDSSGKVDLNAIPADHLYHCKQVIYAVRDEKAPDRDYALVQLDRPVTDREPLTLAADLPVTGALSMIGYPFGTPAKLSFGAHVLLDNPKRESFITNLDAFEGNSGSAVFNDAGAVVGILIGGTPINSFVKDTKAGCQRYNRCDSDGTHCLDPDSDNSIFPDFQRTGSEVQRIAPIRDLVRQQGLAI